MEMKTMIIIAVVAVVALLGLGCGTGMLKCSPTPDVNKTAQ